MKSHYFLAMGPWSNWDFSLSKKPVLWGVKPDASGTNIGVFNQLQIGDIVFFYVSLPKPSKFSKYGMFGIGKVSRKCIHEKEPYWPDEVDVNQVIYTHRFQIEPIKIIINDDDILWFDGLPNVKGLNVIKSDNHGLESLLEAVKNKWNVDIDEIEEKHYLIQNIADFPVLRKAEIDKIFGINYARGITDYRRNDYVVVISSLAGIFRDKIGEEFITYAGEGQKEQGDQTLTGGNLAIVEAKNKGRKLYFLHELKNPKGGRTNDYQFLGEVEYVKHIFKDEHTENRQIISFTLKRIHGPWNLRENSNFNGFDFVHENTQGLQNNSKLISFKKTADNFYFYGYGHVGNFEQESCTAPSRNLFLPITSNLSPFCSEPVLNVDEIKIKEKLEKIISNAKYGISGQKPLMLITILYWISKNKFEEKSLVEHLKHLKKPTSDDVLELLIHNSKLFSDYVLVYKLYETLGLIKFEFDRVEMGYFLKQALEMNTNDGRLITDLSKNDLDESLSDIEPDRAKVLLYSLLKDNLDESTLIDFWSGLYGDYHTIKCSVDILEKIKNQPNFDPESPTIQINQDIYDSLMSQFSEISQTKEVSEGKLRIPTKKEVEKGIKEIQKELLIDDSIIEEIVTHLASGRHVLLAGPVGTGKTRLSQLISDAFWTENCGYFADVRTATADWNTQDVIGGISPKIHDGSRMPTYEIENGCVTDTILANYEKNSRLTDNPLRHTSIHTVNNKQKQFNGTWLIIDEFNRADIDKAFGQLFTALEYNKLIIQDITSGKSTRTIPIPKDYRIIGTLNTADKHYLFNLSDALKRRFAYVEISIPQRNEKNKQREIFLAIKNGLKDLDSDKLIDIIKIDPNNETIVYYPNNVQKNIEYGYNVLEIIREFKPLGTAILKAIYQTLLVSEKMENKDSFDNAINANLVPQLETLPKPSLEILYYYLFGNIIELLETENHLEQYKTGLDALLRYLEFSPDEIKKHLNEFVNGQIPNTLSDKIEKMKKSHSIAFPEKSLFKKSLEEIIKQSEF